MGELPVISGRNAAKAFEKAGWHKDRQTGSHMIYKKDGMALSLSIPDHKSLDRGLLRRLIKDSGLTVNRFKALL
ncbi:MAG TPA: type II toxin-antitoxin system HicA family toxin [Fimbriimonadaceae bacterium]|jgi:predicted RNA binding protein YcfA (HicA-like mRNA interferase family)